MKYKKEIESHNFFSFVKKMPKGCLLHIHIEDSINVEQISKIVKENKEKIYLRDFSKDIINRYPYRLIYIEKPREDDRNINEILNENFKEKPDKKIYDFLKEKFSISSKELEKEKPIPKLGLHSCQNVFIVIICLDIKNFLRNIL